MRLTPLLLSLILAAPLAAPARTKLVTLPGRDALVVSLENASSTLLYEERNIPLQKGNNQIDFAWNGVNVDPNSVVVEMLSNPGDAATATKIISTSLPPNEAALTWLVYSPEARTERIRVSYLLSGIAQDTSYEFRVDKAEKKADFQQYLRLSNQSGEDLDNSTVRVATMDDLKRSVDSGEVRRFLSARNKELALRKMFVCEPGYGMFKGDDGEEVQLVYEIENSIANGLGRYKLPAGKARIFIDDGSGSSIFLGEDILKEAAPGEKSELGLGKVKDVVIKRYMQKNEQTNVRTNNSRQPVLFDQLRQLRYEIENFKEEPVTLKLVEQLNGEWEIREISDKGIRTEKKSLGELILYIDLPANTKGQKAEKKEVLVEFLVKNRFPGEE